MRIFDKKYKKIMFMERGSEVDESAKILDFIDSFVGLSG